jgi:hypothetical protein
MNRVTLSRPACRGILLSGLVLLAAACGSGGSGAGSPASAGSPSSNAAAPSASGSAASVSAALCSDVAAQRNASSVSGVVTVVGGVSATARQLLDAASPSCPSPSASSG